MSSRSSARSRSDFVKGRRSRSLSPPVVAGISSNTSDPTLKHCRIFVGNVVAEKFTPEEIKDRFVVYGKISAVSIHRGFAFVQFEKIESVEEAIKHENSTMFKGARIDVRPAVKHDMGGGGRSNGSRGMSDSRSPERRPSRDNSDYGRHSSSRERSPSRRSSYYDDKYRDSYKRESRSDDRQRYSSRDTSSRSRFEESYPRITIKEQVLDPNRPNDCEIIVVSKDLRAYAESVESRLKNLGLTVDLLFLKDIAAMLPTIDDIACRGSLFAIVVADQNETHRSVTLNILHGTPQEHRNMPLDDAMKLVALKYHEYVQALRDKMMKGVSTTADTVDKVSATPMQTTSTESARSAKLQSLLNLLANGKYLTAAELEVVINYLQDQRNEILTRERGDHLRDKLEDSPVMPQYGQPQANANLDWHYDSAKASSSSQVPAVAPPMDQQAPVPKPSSSFLNFDNPTVKKALDSLIQSGPNLLQSVLSNKRPADPVIDANHLAAGSMQAKKGKASDDLQRPAQVDEYHQQAPKYPERPHGQYQDQYPPPQQQHPTQPHPQQKHPPQHPPPQHPPPPQQRQQQQQHHHPGNQYMQYNQEYNETPPHYDQAPYHQQQDQQYQDQEQYGSGVGVKYNKPQPGNKPQGQRHPLLGTPVSGQFMGNTSHANRTGVLARNMRSSRDGFF